MHFTLKLSTKPFPGLRAKTISVLFSIIILGTMQKVFGQVAEDFSDGELLSNPTWSGTVSSFVVNDGAQLQLNAGVAGVAWLSTPLPWTQAEEVTWELFVKQSFAPSAANFGMFYLVSDQPEFTASLNGYYLQFGESGSNDAVELFRQNGTNKVSICRASAGGIASSFAIRVKVTRDTQGVWKLFIDYAGGNEFVLEGVGNDPTPVTGMYSGVVCTYTITNATRFYFDDIRIHSVEAPDVIPPKVAAVNIISSESLQVVYSENVSESSAGDPLNYLVTPIPGHPVTAQLQADERTVVLFFSLPFMNGEPSSLTVKSIDDLYGNTMPVSITSFLHFEQKPVNYRDIIVTEFCADPSPPRGLPEAEFVEIYNRSENPVDLGGWKLKDEITSGQIESFILLPGRYSVLAATSNVGKFTAGEALPVSSFPSLNNSGDLIQLENAEGKTIDSVRYDISWYRDSEKSDGGWSFELIDVYNICAERSNWAEAEAPSGGTPGQQNSIYANKPDNTGPKIQSLALVNPSTLLIQFDEKLESVIPSTEKFHIDPPVEITSVAFADASLSALLLTFSMEIPSSEIHKIEVSGIYDCSGNQIQPGYSRAQFVLPEKAVAGDVLINEVLFNPRSTGVDFIEIFNHSKKTIDLNSWMLRNFNAPGNNSAIVSHGTLLLHPGEYKVFSEDVNVLKGEYMGGKDDAFFETNLPALNDDDGTLTLFDGEGLSIDSMAYDADMHVAFLKDEEGVSLERISWGEAGTIVSNWRSASSTSGFATPGLLNSNVRGVMPVGDEAVQIEPEIIQPADAMRAFTLINYRFEKGGFIGNVRIYDHQGRRIRAIAENQLLGTEGFFRWDGEDDSGMVARTGYYLVWFEIFDDRGNVKAYRKRVAIY